MSDQSLHPGIIYAIALIPVALIVILTWTILKGFDLLPNLRARWTKARRRPQLPVTDICPVGSTRGSLTTIESAFIGQSRNGSVETVTRPEPIHDVRKPMVGGRHPLSVAHSQERKIHAGPPQQPKKIKQRKS